MAKEEHVEWIKDGHEAWNSRRSLIKFSPDLSGLSFRNAIPDWYDAGPRSDFFKKFNFADADLREADFSGLNFSRARFERADLSDSNLTGAIFNGAKFTQANLSRVKATGAEFANARFSGAIFEDARLENANFRGADLNSVTLQDVQRQEVIESITRGLDLQFDHYAEHARGLASSPAPKVPENKEPTYQVIFATNRNLCRNGPEISFGSERDTVLHYGSCQVYVPKSHKIGSVGSPFWKRWFKGDDRLKIRKLVLLDGELHWKLIRDNFVFSKSASPLTLLIHGYNNDFDSAVLWAAQIGYDLGLERGINLFSWPSKGAKKAYAADEATVEASKYVLADYVLSLIENCEGVGINILGHSMGCRCLIGALEIIGHKHPEKLSSINQIIFAAADVDQDVMKYAGVHTVLNSGRTTSYVCGGDVALTTSGWLHAYARVGLLPPVFIFDQIDTVEVEKTDLLNLGHGYVAEAKPVLNDIFQIIVYSAAPENRFSIKPASPLSPAHWRLVD